MASVVHHMHLTDVYLLIMQIVTHAIETQNVVTTCAGGELLKNMLPHLLEQLELCQKSLSAYLETKRAEFPRWAVQAAIINASSYCPTHAIPPYYFCLRVLAALTEDQQSAHYGCYLCYHASTFHDVVVAHWLQVLLCLRPYTFGDPLAWK